MGNITIRMNDDLKARVNQTLDAIGMNFNTYVTMASIQLVNQQRLPFDTSVRAAEPNEQTKRAMLAAASKDRYRYRSIRAMFKPEFRRRQSAGLWQRTV